MHTNTDRFFLFNGTATTEIYTLSLHDALPISAPTALEAAAPGGASPLLWGPIRAPPAPAGSRSEEHTSELQSQSNLVCRLLLEKKKNSIPTSMFPILPPPRSSHPMLALPASTR